MKRSFFLIVLISFCCTAFSQVNFESGYFVKQNKERVECLIKNLGWRNTPEKIYYKLKENESEERHIKAEEIVEFEIYSGSHYIKANVQIDVSTDKLSELTKNSNPDWKEQKLLLKILSEGEATLYSYENQDQIRFFYKKRGDVIKQLIYKRYLSPAASGKRLRTNATYRQQLIEDLPCDAFGRKKIVLLKYNTTDMVKYFNCFNDIEEIVDTNITGKSSEGFNFFVKAGASFNTLKIDNSKLDSRSLDFGSNTNFTLEGEFEYVLPYNKDKWVLVSRFAFHSFKADKDKFIKRVISEQNIGASIDYKYLDFAVGARYRMYLKESTRIHIGALFVPNVVVDNNGKIDFYDSNLNDLDIDHGHSFVVEAGFVVNNWVVGLSYYPKRNLLTDYTAWSSNYNCLSLTVGYQLF